MVVLITGSEGFIGWHLQCALSTYDTIEVRLANKKVFGEHNSLDAQLKGCDVVVHLAGVNRASDEEIYDGNTQLAQNLIDSCTRTKTAPHIVFSSSTHAENPTTIYGKSKFDAKGILDTWAFANNAVVTTLVMPHIFGEHGRPQYNSAVATFCDAVARGQTPEVHREGQLELLHVQDLCDEIIRLIHTPPTMSDKKRLSGTKISVGEAYDLIVEFSSQYRDNIVPDLANNFEKKLFNTYRSYIPYNQRAMPATLHSDERGWLFEVIKVKSGGQCFISSTRPGITRGQHFHRRKFERFCVAKGEAIIQMRKLFTDEIIEYRVSGETPCFIDMPTLHTHNITNVGKEELITLFWADEFFDSDNPDTYWLEV